MAKYSSMVSFECCQYQTLKYATYELNLALYYHKRTVYCSLIVDADEMKSKALSNAQRAIQDQEARVC